MFVLVQPALFSSGKHERHLHTANRAEVEIQTLRAQGDLGWCGLVVMENEVYPGLYCTCSVPSRAQLRPHRFQNIPPVANSFSEKVQFVAKLRDDLIA